MSCAAGLEFRGMSSNAALNRPATLSSRGQIQSANTDARLAVDGNIGQHLFIDGCAATQREDAPWWRVDFGYSLPVAVVRYFGRKDNLDHITEGLQVRIGDSSSWKQNTVCAQSFVQDTLTRVTVVNCVGTAVIFSL